MAHGQWLLTLAEEIADKVRNDALGGAAIGHRLSAISHHSISEHTTVPFLQLAMREGYFCMSV